MRKHGAAFADNAQAAPALPDKHTRKQKECGGGSPGPARGPQPYHRGASHSPPSPGTLCPPRPWAQLGNVGAPSQLWRPWSAPRGGDSSLKDLHSHCPLVPIPGWWKKRARHGRDKMGWAVPACGLQSPCSGAAPPVPPGPGRGGQGPVPRVLTQRDSNAGGTNLGLSRTSSSSTEAPWSRQNQATSKAPRQHPQLLLPLMALHSPG